MKTTKKKKNTLKGPTALSRLTDKIDDNKWKILIGGAIATGAYFSGTAIYDYNINYDDNYVKTGEVIWTTQIPDDIPKSAQLEYPIKIGLDLKDEGKITILFDTSDAQIDSSRYISDAQEMDSIDGKFENKAPELEKLLIKGSTITVDLKDKDISIRNAKKLLKVDYPVGYDPTKNENKFIRNNPYRMLVEVIEPTIIPINKIDSIRDEWPFEVQVMNKKGNTFYVHFNTNDEDKDNDLDINHPQEQDDDGDFKNQAVKLESMIKKGSFIDVEVYNHEDVTKTVKHLHGVYKTEPAEK